MHAQLVEKSLEIYFGEENKTKQFITEMISSVPQEKKKKSQAQWKTAKKCTWINYEKEKVSLNEEKLIGIKIGFVHICKVQGEDFSVEQKRGIWEGLAA